MLESDHDKEEQNNACAQSNDSEETSLTNGKDPCIIKKGRERRKAKDSFRKASRKNLDAIKEFYGIRDDFGFDQMYTRSDEESVLTYVTSTISEDYLNALDRKGTRVC